MIGLFCYILIHHGVAVVFIPTREVNRLHQIAIVADRKFEIFAIFCKVCHTKRKDVLDF